MGRAQSSSDAIIDTDSKGGYGRTSLVFGSMYGARGGYETAAILPSSLSLFPIINSKSTLSPLTDSMNSRIRHGMGILQRQDSRDNSDNRRAVKSRL